MRGQVGVLLMAVTGWMPCLGSSPAADPNLVTAGSRTVSAPARLSLAEAKMQAFSNNWDLLAARSDVDIAVAQKIVAKQFPNPFLSLSTAKISADSQGNGTPMGNGLWDRSYDTIAGINQLFEIGGKRASRKASAGAGLKGAEARLADARRQLDAAVAKAYVAAALAERNAEILHQSAGMLGREESIARKRLDAGDISQTDLNQIQIASDRLELDARAAEANARTARIFVEVLMGVSEPAGHWSAADTLESLADVTLPAEVSPMSSQRPDLVAAEADRARAQADLELQRAQRMPDPTLSFQYEHAPPDMPNTVGIGLSFPLPLWNRNEGGIAAAQAVRHQAATNVGKIRAQVAAEVTSSRFAYDDARARWRRYHAEITPRSEDIRKSVSFAYGKGSASLLDLLVAQRNDNEVRLATAQAAADAATAASVLKAALNISEPIGGAQ